MPFLNEQRIDCPYCGEQITILLEPLTDNESALGIEMPDLELDNYIEDCQVCCRPIVIKVFQNSEGEQVALAMSEND